MLWLGLITVSTLAGLLVQFGDVLTGTGMAKKAIGGADQNDAKLIGVLNFLPSIIDWLI